MKEKSCNKRNEQKKEIIDSTYMIINKQPSSEDEDFNEEKNCTPIIKDALKKVKVLPGDNTRSPLKIISVKTDKLQVGIQNNLLQWISQQLSESSLEVGENSILAITSKALSYLQGRVIPLSRVKVSEQAQRLSVKYKRDPKLLQLIINEADTICYHNKIVSLTMKNGIYTANAGIDTSNVPEGYVALWPEDPEQVAVELRSHLTKKYNITNFGIIITDSICIPARKGTIAISIGHSGFDAVEDLKGKKDLFNNEFQYASLNKVDSIATAANLMMGEGDDCCPLAVIEGAPVNWSIELAQNEKIDPQEDLFRILIDKKVPISS